MKKVFVLFLIMSFTGLRSSAQKYVVFSMLGKVNVTTKKGIRPLGLREVVTPNTKVVMPYDGELVLLDQPNKRKYTIKTPGNATIGQFLKDSRNQSVGLTRVVFEAMVKRIASKGETIIQTVEDNITITRELPKDSSMVAPPKQTIDK